MVKGGVTDSYLLAYHTRALRAGLPFRPPQDVQDSAEGPRRHEVPPEAEELVHTPRGIAIGEVRTH